MEQKHYLVHQLVLEDSILFGICIYNIFIYITSNPYYRVTVHALRKQQRMNLFYASMTGICNSPQISFNSAATSSQTRL